MAKPEGRVSAPPRIAYYAIDEAGTYVVRATYAPANLAGSPLASNELRVTVR